MMRVLYLTAIGLLASAGNLFANMDSVGVKVINDRLFIVHKVEKGEGLYAVSRRYNVPVQKIADNNPGAMKGLELNQLLMVPTNKMVYTAPKTTPPQKTETASAAPKPKPATPTATAVKEPKYHIVQRGETLYRISVNHNLSVSQIVEWNKLPNNNIEVGQKLWVEKPSANAQYATSTPVAKTAADQKPALQSTSNGERKPGPDGTITPLADAGYGSLVDPKYKKEYDAYMAKLDEKEAAGRVKRKEVEESGMATWVDDGSMKTGLLLALHRTAPPGTLIKVTNPMNGRYIFVKVIAKLAAEGEDANVMIKITQTAARQLNLKDKYFRLDLHYGMDVIK